MRLEQAILFLRDGCRIHRPGGEKFLHGTTENPLNSFYLTLWDVLAEDWEISTKEIERVYCKKAPKKTIKKECDSSEHGSFP